MMMLLRLILFLSDSQSRIKTTDSTFFLPYYNGYEMEQFTLQLDNKHTFAS